MKLGANVATCSRNNKNLNNLSKKFKILLFKKILVFKHDLNQLGNEKAYSKKIEKFFNNKIDILINNSGGPPPKLILKTSDKDWSKAMNINFLVP